MLAAIADTHAVIWYIFADQRLSSQARKAIDKAADQGLHVGVSTITLAEIVYLAEKNRIAQKYITQITSPSKRPATDSNRHSHHQPNHRSYAIHSTD